MKDELNILFKEGCPEPGGSAEFKAGVLKRIDTAKTHAARTRPRRGFVGLFCSPIPVILAVAVLLVVFRDSITGFMSKDLAFISSDSLLISSCCVAVIAIVVSYIKDLSDERSAVDWDSINVSLQQDTASSRQLKQ